MSISNPFAAKTDGVSKLTAAEVTASGVAHTHALDKVAGDTCTPAAPIIINGSGYGGLVTQATTVSAKVTMSGTGGRTVWRQANSSDADGTYTTANDEYRLPGTLTGTRIYTLNHSVSPTPSTGERIRFARNVAVSGTARIQREDSTILFTFSSSDPSMFEACWNGTAWVFSNAYGGTLAEV